MSADEIKKKCKATSEHYRLLADEIIIKAAKEFKHAYKHNLKHEIQELTDFFLGKWYATLTKIPGHKMLEKLKEHSTNKSKKMNSLMQEQVAPMSE